MSVPSTDLKHKYEGNGVQTAWPFTFKVFTKQEILVKKITSGGESVLVLDVDYTVSGAGDDSVGGFVNYPILGDKLAVGEFIVLKPNLNYSQNLVLLNQNTFPPKSVEYAMDRLAMQIKQVAEQLSRSLQLTDAYDGSADDFISMITAGSAGLIASLSGTSLSNVTIGTGSKTFITESGKSWSLGQRLRAASDDGLKIIEGPVTAYSGTSLTIGADFTAGSGSHSDWNISLAGERGANGAGSGDILAANNGSDFADALTTFDNLKQAATTSYSGVARFATQSEVDSGVAVNAIVTPETLQAKIDAFNSANGVKILHLQHTETSGNSGGTSTSGAWRQLPVNNKAHDDIGSTLSSNQFTLPAGTYEIEADQEFYATNVCKIKLYNVTDSVDEVIGSSSYTRFDATNSVFTAMKGSLYGIFTITAEKTFEFQYRTGGSNPGDGLGIASGFGTEIYLDAIIRKIG